MTAIPFTSGADLPTPVLELNYAAERQSLPPMIRVGGVAGFIGVVMCILYVPFWMADSVLLDYHARPTEPFVEAVCWLAPLAQMLCAGVGLTLVIVGKYLSRAKLRSGVILALMLNVLALTVAIREGKRDSDRTFRSSGPLIQWNYSGTSTI